MADKISALIEALQVAANDVNRASQRLHEAGITVLLAASEDGPFQTIEVRLHGTLISGKGYA